jgi:hypothetical protein
MKKITKNTILKQENKFYNAVEVDGVIFWVGSAISTQNFGEWCYKEIIFRFNKNSAYDTFNMPKKIVAQSTNKLDGVPVISLDKYIRNLAHDTMLNYLTNGNPDGDFKHSTIGADENKIWWTKGYKSNPNLYTLKDIEKAYEMGYNDRDMDIGYGSNLPYCIEQINSISVIEVDEQFNIISYE